MKGTRLKWPSLKAAIGCSGMIVPTIGPITYWLEALAVPASVSTCAAVRLRGHFAVAAPVPEPQPAGMALLGSLLGGGVSGGGTWAGNCSDSSVAI